MATIESVMTGGWFGVATGDPEVSASEIATAVWSAAARTLTAGTNLNDLSSAQAQAAVAAALAAYDPPTHAELLARTLASADYTVAVASALATYDPPTHLELLARTLPTASYPTLAGIAGLGLGLGPDSISDETLDPDLDIYQARVTLVADNVNDADRYGIVWYKNGHALTSGVTGPTIRVFLAANASDLIAETALTEVGSEGLYTYLAEGSERITSGVLYFAQVTATIDSEERVSYETIYRDAEAAS